MASTPRTTKAWTYTRTGPPRQVLSLTTTHPFPIFPPPNPSDEEWLLIRVSYAALNPGDGIIMAVLPFAFRSTKTAVPGYDLTGTVVDVWTAASSSSTPTSASPEATQSRFQKGDAVIAFIVVSHMLRTGAGALQGTVAIPAKYVVKIPAHNTRREAAGLLLTACTAAEVVKNASLKRGDKVLVVGASGGIGSAAVQLVRDAVGADDHGDGGGRVVAVCSGRNEAMVKGLGAGEVIDYTLYANLPNELARLHGHSSKPFDAIVDTFGDQNLYKHSSQYLKPDGIYSAAGIHSTGYSTWPILKAGIAMTANALWPRSPWLGGSGRTWIAASMMDPGLELMESLVALLGQGKLRVAVDSVWSFEQVHEAFDVQLSGRARGKVIVKVNGDEGEE